MLISPFNLKRFALPWLLARKQFHQGLALASVSITLIAFVAGCATAAPPSPSDTQTSGRVKVWRYHTRAAEEAQRNGNTAAAEAALRAALAEAEGFSKKDIRRAQTIDNLGNLLMERGKYKEAADLYEKAVQSREEAVGETHPHIAYLLKEWGRSLTFLGQYGRAEELHLKALEIIKLYYGEHHHAGVSYLRALAFNYLAAQQLDKAEHYAKQALDLAERPMGATFLDDDGLSRYRPRVDQLSVAGIQGTLGLIYQKQKRHDEAREAYKRAIAMIEQERGKESPALDAPLTNLAILESSQENYVAAAALLERNLAIVSKAVSPDHPARIGVLAQLLKVQVELTRLSPSAEVSRRLEEVASELFKHVTPKEQSQMAGKAYDDKQWLLASLLFQNVVNHLDQTEPNNLVMRGEAYNFLGTSLANTDRHQQAIPAFEQALGLKEKTLGPEHPRIRALLEEYALSLAKLDRKDELAAVQARIQQMPGAESKR